MTNQEYLRNGVLGAAWPYSAIGGVQSHATSPKRPDPTQVSVLLELDALQIQRQELKQTATRRGQTSALDEPIEEILARSVPPLTQVEWSLADFERDMDLFADGFVDLQLGYRGTHSREDISRDDD